MSELFGLPRLVEAFLQFIEILALVTILHKLLPATHVKGYVCDWTGRPLSYRLNGFAVLLWTVGIYSTLSYFGIKDPTFLATTYISTASVACLIGLTASVTFYLRSFSNPPQDHHYRRCLTSDMTPSRKSDLRDNQSHSRSFIEVFYAGFEFNPRVWGMDVKMMLYLYGAVVLELVVLSCGALQMKRDGELSAAMGLVVGMYTWFAVEYMWNEDVHLYTYDLFAEKIGFKLLFGCLFFYPFFYPLPIYVLATYGTHSPISLPTALFLCSLFFVGWILTRGSNLQKYHHKISPKAQTFRFLALSIPQRTLKPNSRILVSGFWSLSRHINYAGEIIQALAISLVVTLGIGFDGTGTLLAMQYPGYYVALFVPREIEDGKVCAKKYGADWVEYCRRVRWRIVPYIY